METKIRKELVDYIKDNLINASEDAVSKIYTKIYDVLNSDKNYVSDQTSDNDEFSRYKCVSSIENNLKYMKKEDLEYIEKIINGSAIKESQEEKMKSVALEIINKILVEMGKEEIQDLCEFIDVRREELIKDKYSGIINDNLKYVFNNGFLRSECMVYQKTIKYRHLSIMKGMLKSVGHELCSKRTHRTINNIRVEDTFYSIKKETVE
jgi:hypothetical protein